MRKDFGAGSQIEPLHQEQPRFPHQDPAIARTPDYLLIQIHAPHIVANLAHEGAADKANISRTYYPYLHLQTLTPTSIRQLAAHEFSQ
jgi:hypothetical protein